MSKVTMTLEERTARYERFRDLYDNQRLTLAAIASREDPPLSKEMVRRILKNGTPKAVGRPPGAGKRKEER